MTRPSNHTALLAESTNKQTKKQKKQKKTTKQKKTKMITLSMNETNLQDIIY
jgi:hypothetical protein